MPAVERRGIPFHVVSAGTSPDAKLVRAGPCELTKLWIFNVASAARFVHLYDKATAPVVGTDVPVLTFGVGGATTGVFNNINPGEHPEVAITFVNGLGLGISTGASDTDTGAPSAGDVAVSGTFR